MRPTAAPFIGPVAGMIFIRFSPGAHPRTLNETSFGAQYEADEMFARLLSIRNYLGLLAEEFDPVARRQLGNFPQTFSHLALDTVVQFHSVMKLTGFADT